MSERNAPDKNKASTRCVREIPQRKKEASTGCVRETPHRKVKPVWDM